MSEPELPDAAMPGLVLAADAESLRGQRRQLTSTALRLALAVAAAVFGAFSLELAGGLDAAALLVALFFVSAFVVELWQAHEQPGTSWYDGRAVAESAKSLTWRYVMRATPYDDADRPARKRFVADLRRLLADVPGGLVLDSADPSVTTAMDGLRAADLDRRRRAYLDERIDDQRGWYRGKSRHAAERARRWRLLLMGAELLGVVVALARALDWFDVDAPGVVSAVVAAGAAWLSTRQYEANARAYALAAQELDFVRAGLVDAADDTELADRVADAEQAISREHTMWRAARDSRGPAPSPARGDDPGDPPRPPV